jgi:4-hydroxy-tetrahydrodipicolinate synthase
LTPEIGGSTTRGVPIGSGRRARTGSRHTALKARRSALSFLRNDPGWARVRPPLVELTTEQAKLLAAELKAVGFAMNGIRRD